MLPSRGLARVVPGALAKNQILARTPTRSNPSLATFRTSLGSSRQFGTTLKTHGRPVIQSSRAGLLSSGRLGAATLLSSQTIFLASSRRFASTDSEPPTSSAWAEPTPSSPSPSELSSDFSALDALDVSIADIPQKVGYLANLGLDYGWGPTSICQWALEHAHFTAGLPWGLSILAVTVVMRAVIFYPSLLAQQEQSKMNVLRKNPIYNDLQKNMLAMTLNNNSTQDALIARMQMKLMESEAGVVKRRIFYPFIQIPFTFAMYKLCRGMAALPVPGLETQGFWWFTDLTVSDPLYILPCISTAMLFLSTKRSADHMPGQAAGIMKALPWIIGPISILVTISMPANVVLFFAFASILQYVQTSIFFNHTTRAMFGLPPLHTTHAASPYTSKFSNATYQAPRTVNTTAREKGKASKMDSLNPINKIKDVYGQLTESVNNMQGGDPKTRERKKAAGEFEAQRRKEEADKYFARRDMARYKQEKKK